MAGQAGDEYTCEGCGGTFQQTRGDDEALDESRETFGFVPPEHERAYLCDECWPAFLAWARERGLTV